MNIRTLIVRLAKLIGIAFLMYAPATYAATATTQFNVMADVAGTCNVNMSGDLNFGNYTGALITGVPTTLNLQCTANEPVTIAMNYGQHPTGANVRRMANGGSYLLYRIGKNASCTNQWGNSGGELVIFTPPNGNWQHIPVYGCVAGGQYGVTGIYHDTVTVTVNFI